MEQSMGPPIGIDLGTAWMRVSVFDGKNHHGNYAMPSYVAFTEAEVLIGEAARSQAMQNPSNTIFDIIRLIGRRYSDPSVQNDMRRWPFKVIRTPEDDILLVEVRWRNKIWHFTPVEICSMILIQMKDIVERSLRTIITDAVITVPAYFTYKWRQEIKRACLIAGLNVLQIINAPAASAMFYGMGGLSKSSNKITNFMARAFKPSEAPEEHNIIIFDLGAGTLDVSLVTIIGNASKVRTTAGDVHLGGSDFDNNLVDHFLSLLEEQGLRGIGNIPGGTIINLRTLCEKAKIQLSYGNSSRNSKVLMKISPFYKNVNLDSSITESKFQTLNMQLFQRCTDVIEKCLRDANIGTNAVDEVFLAGGSARIPHLQHYICRFFHCKGLKVSPHMEMATAYGAALQAFSLTSSVNGSTFFPSVQDVTPFSLGLRTVHGDMEVYVPKNTNIPTKKERSYHISNNQTSFHMEIYEGEKITVCENDLLGKFDFSVDHSSPNGNTVVVSFEVDRNGTLTVMAEDIYTGMKKSITIENKNIDESRKRVWDAIFYKESEDIIMKEPTTKSLTRSNTSSKWGQMKENGILDKVLSMKKERPKMIIGQSSRQYNEPKEYAIGIDFGTTYSSVAVWQQNGVKIIENEYGNRLNLSVVAFTDTGRLIGDTVNRDQVKTDPANIISGIKRSICGGKTRSMVSVYYKNEEKSFAPEEIAAMILTKMKEIAEAHLSSKVSKAVISVPASFNNSQRKAIKDAGVIAGLNVLQLLNDTTAAAIAYFLQKVDRQGTSEKTWLVFDLGGGYLDVSIVKIKGGNIRVLAVAGDTNLGGEDFDNNMVSNFIGKFMEEKNKDIRNKPRSLRRLRAACEKAKRILSTNAQTVVEVDALDEGIDFRSVIARKEFEEMNDALFKKCISCVERCLEDAMLKKSSVDEIVLVGGSTRIPKIHQLLQEFFNRKELCKSINADEAVVHGAAVQAAILFSGNEDRKKFHLSELQDVTTAPFWHVNGEIMNLLIPKHTPIPAKKEMILSNCSDNLSSFSIKVQERELASMEVQDFEFKVSGIAQKMRRHSRLDLAFEVDSSGILNLTGKDVTGGEEKEIGISKDNCGLTVEEIQKMSEAAAHYKAEDEEYKKRTAALNSLENLAYKIKAMARDPEVSPLDKTRMDDAADHAIKWIDENQNATMDEIDSEKKRLEEAPQKEVPKTDVDGPSDVPDGPN